MTTKNAIDALSLSSLTMKANGDIVIPKGKVVEVQSHEELLNLPGKLHNLGTLRFLFEEASFEEFFNTGLVETSKDTFVLNVTKLRNHGVIKAPKVLKINSKSELSINPNGKEGAFEASESVEVRASSSIVAKKSTFLSEKVIFESEMGDVTVIAQRISGKVSLKGKDLTVETIEGDLDIESNEATGFVKVKAFTNLSIPPTSQSGDYAGAGTNVTGGPVSVTGTNGESIGIEADEALDVLALTAASGGIQASAGESLEITGNVTAELEIILSSNGSFDVTGDVKTTGQGNILLFAEGTLEVTGKVDSAAAVRIGNSDAKTDTGGDCTIEVTGKISGKDGNIIITAGNNISLGDVEITGTSVAGAIDIWANRGFSSGQGSDLFNLGGGGDNGCGNLSTSNTTGGGSATDTVVGGVKVQNNGTGGISVDSASAIAVSASASKNGNIILSAQNGPVTLPSGTFSVNGASGQGAGLIAVSADTLTVGETILTASDDDSGTRHHVWVACRTLNGTKLTMKANGNGVIGSGTYNADVLLVSQGTFVITDDLDLADLDFGVTLPGGLTGGNGSITVESGEVEIQCDGDGNAVWLAGKNLQLNGDEVSISCKGDQTFVGLQYTGENEGTLQITAPSLTISVEGDDSDGGVINLLHQAIDIDSVIDINASGDTGDYAGGSIIIESKGNFTLNGNDGTIKANGKGSEDGGLVRIRTIEDSPSFPSFSNFTASANAEGEGNGGQVISEAKRITFTAVDLESKGGEEGGNGNSISVNCEEHLTLVDECTFDASARGEDGNGGSITLYAGAEILNLDSEDITLKVNAGEGDGDAGTIDIHADGAGATISCSANISADAKGTGQGGYIWMTSETIDINGGTIKVNGDAQDGLAGTVRIEGQLAITLDDAEVFSKGGDHAAGSQVFLYCFDSEGTIELANTTVSAQGGLNGGGTGFIDINCIGYFSMDEDSEINVSGMGGNEPGGTIHITSEDIIDCFGQLKADGFGFREGGEIEISSLDLVDLTSSTLTANGGIESGDGGLVIIESEETVTVNGSITARGEGFGWGGGIFIQADTLAVETNAFFDVNGGEEGGAGGDIEIDTEQVLNMIIRDTYTFAARGYDEAEGGKVIIRKVDTFDIHKLISVDSGSEANDEVFGGSIELNDVEAVRKKTGNGSWPEHYWICDNTAAEANVESIQLSAFTLPSTFRADLVDVNIYAMDNETQFRKYLHLASAPETADGISNRAIKVSAAFANVDSEDCSDTMSGAILHELGHQLSRIRGDLHDGIDFDAAIGSDVSNINGESCNDVFGADQCSAYPAPGYPNNWTRLAAIFSDEPDELFAYSFGYRAAQLGNGTLREDIAQCFFYCTAMQAYMDGLWIAG